MKRRDFISTNVLAAAGISSIVLESCNNQSKPNESPSGESPADVFDLNEMSVPELQQKMSGNTWTSEAITQKYIDRIKAIDQAGIALHAVIELNPDALQIAKAMDEERKAGKVRGLLHGIPVFIKDNIDTADQMQTTAGSLALEGHKAKQDAFLVKKLRDAGAVILGKTNLSEWANFRSSRSSSGWSSRGGQTRNPYVLDRSPCGSSSGSAVAVAANLCAVAIGTETDGSIACPASINGIVGIKPTVGLVSRSGIIPISKTQDTAGPFGRTVQDAVILLESIIGKDPNDPYTQQSPAKTDWMSALDPKALKGKRIGVEKRFLKQHEAIDDLLSAALETMRQQGATIVEVEYMKSYEAVSSDEYTVLLYEFKDGLNTYLASHDCPVRTLKELIDYNEKQARKMMPYFRQEILEEAEAKGGLDSPEYKEALKKCSGLRPALEKLMHDQDLHALCGPATGLSWCIDTINGDHWTGYGSYGPAAVAGMPSVTVPMGQAGELPVGISFLGKAYDEATLIGISYAYEQASRKRQAPVFRKSFSQ